MARVLLLLPTATYRATDFLEAARALDVDVVVGSEQEQTMAPFMQDRALHIPLDDARTAVDAVLSFARRVPLDAIVAVDDQGVVVAAAASRRLGLPYNAPDAVAATRNKARMREVLAGSAVPQPAFRVVLPDDRLAELAAAVGYPCVVKPVALSGSRGVIRADTPEELRNAAARTRAILRNSDECTDETMVVERYVPGVEVAVEGLLRGGRLEVLAIFDKPDPLEGPYFEETLYVTPSRLPDAVQSRIVAVAGEAAAVLGLTEGPVHAELRWDGREAWMLELAARSIGGLCSRALRFGMGVSLEELILRHALGLPLEDLSREASASGVMMVPIPRSGVLERVGGQREAFEVAGVAGVEITARPGRPVQALPEGDRYLGFIFARADRPEQVEQALRDAYARLDILIT